MPANYHAILHRRTLLKRSAIALPAAFALGGTRPRQSLSAPLLTFSSRQSDTREALVAGNSAFAFDIYGELRKHVVGNLVFSPYSQAQAQLDEIAAQMAKALSFSLPQPALHDAFGSLSADLVDRGTAPAFPSLGEPARSLRIAQAIWGDQTYPFSEAFSSQLETSYGAAPRQTDFINAPEKARVHINEWVAEDRIQEIAPVNSITSRTRMVLANAVYFSGAWEMPFVASETREAAFYPGHRDSIDVPFMHNDGQFPYARANSFQLIDFRFQGSGFAMTIILPDFGNFDSFEQTLDTDVFAEAVSLASSSLVKVSFPKFRFDSRSNGLKESLRSLGMVNAFEAEHADFSAMVEGTPPEPLFLGDVLHKAFIGVDEIGAEAAAATVVQASAGGVSTRPEDIYEMRIDHPFFFAIRDSETGTPLFLGRVMNPSA